MSDRSWLWFLLRVTGASFSVGVGLVVLVAFLLVAADVVLPGSSKIVVLYALTVILAAMAAGNWTRFGLLVHAYVQAPDDKALRATVGMAMPAAIGASFAVLLGVNNIIGLPLRPPFSTSILVLAVMLLSTPAVLFSWRYRAALINWIHRHRR